MQTVRSMTLYVELAVQVTAGFHFASTIWTEAFSTAFCVFNDVDVFGECIAQLSDSLPKEYVEL
jgi:hypothetical protein